MWTPALGVADAAAGSGADQIARRALRRRASRKETFNAQIRLIVFLLDPFTTFSF
jgi:hypothetical protein